VRALPTVDPVEDASVDLAGLSKLQEVPFIIA
jgi:hypothetical protein